MRRRPAKGLAVSYPASFERRYRAYNSLLVEDTRLAINREVVPAYVRALEEHLSTVRADAWSDWIEGAINSIKLSLTDRLFQGRRMVVALAEDISDFAKKPWQRLAERQIGVNVFKHETWLGPLLESWSTENAKLITSIPEQYLDRVAQRAQDMVRQGRSTKFFRDELIKLYQLTQSRANLIARTEVAKLNGQITKSRQLSLGVPEYTWSTSADERVRESHKVLNGKICRYDDPTVYRNEGETEWRKRSSLEPPGYEGDPGEDFQCRCVAAARVEQFIADLLR